MTQTAMNKPGLTCHEVIQLVTDYLEGALDPMDAARVEEHLAVCEGCTSFIEQIRATIRVAGAVREDDLAPETRERLVEAFRDWKRGDAPSGVAGKLRKFFER